MIFDIVPEGIFIEMKQNNKLLIALLSGCLMFGMAACNFATPASPVTSPSSIPPGQTVSANISSPAQFEDPFAYCTAVVNIDTPDTRYGGQKMPEAVVKGLMKASGAPSDAPIEVFTQGSLWRCMDSKVYACFVGANLPCDAKADTSQAPTSEEIDYCHSNPNADFIPAAVTGHETIYAWSCQGGKPITGKQVWQVDERGFIADIWYAIDRP